MAVLRRVGWWMALCLLLPTWRVAGVDQGFIHTYCVGCHDGETRKGGLDLTTLKAPGDSPGDFGVWVGVHDRVAAGEMPPASRKVRPKARELGAFTNGLAAELVRVETVQVGSGGRAVQRRLNRTEYEETVRDLLHLPVLEVRGFLPEDTSAHGFTKVGTALDVSHVHLGRYLAAAEFALREAMAPQVERPQTTTNRYATWDQPAFWGLIPLEGPRERRTFPLVGLELRRDLMAKGRPDVPQVRDREHEAMGVVVSTYEPTEIRFSRFRAPVTGRYRLRAAGYTFWMGRQFTNVTRGRRDEPVTFYSDADPRILRKLGSFDFGPEPAVRELVVELRAGETIRPDAARLHRSRPPDHRNPLAEADGMPGVAFQWLEVEGPLLDEWPPAGHRLMFGDLSMTNRPPPAPMPGRGKRFQRPSGVLVQSRDPLSDAARLIRGFMERAYRRPVEDADVRRFVGVVKGAMGAGFDFTDAMVAGYTAVLSSPGFLYFDAPKVGRLDGMGVAERLSYFLWNSAPDTLLRTAAARGELSRASGVRAQATRLLADPRSLRFVEAFLDSWLDLRVLADTAPDEQLYPDYQLDDLLVESMAAETQSFFAELLKDNAGVAALVDADFVMVNDRLATHYGMEGVRGVGLRRVKVPPGSVRGGLLTQASVLKVTSNGTSTSPVRRGAWVMNRIIGRPPPPPPPSVPAVEPDIRGATTIREQLSKHRTLESCNACHRLIDPAGFALESFDVMGGWRERYRVSGGEPVKGIGHNGNFYHFGLGPAVDASGELPDGRMFSGVRELKRCLAAEPEQLARNLLRQWTVYATGAPVRFSDRVTIEAIVARNRGKGWPVRSMLLDLVESRLFREK